METMSFKSLFNAIPTKGCVSFDPSVDICTTSQLTLTAVVCFSGALNISQKNKPGTYWTNFTNTVSV